MLSFSFLLLICGPLVSASAKSDDLDKLLGHSVDWDQDDFLFSSFKKLRPVLPGRISQKQVETIEVKAPEKDDLDDLAYKAKPRSKSLPIRKSSFKDLKKNHFKIFDVFSNEDSLSEKVTSWIDGISLDKQPKIDEDWPKDDQFRLGHAFSQVGTTNLTSY